ncbi:hypothetical protein [Halococcus salsus]|uniref:hypothetical protein n=1 Tax=Halococcus salsus TaxID=2162894 RepID=UPI001F04C6D5|nr:hypothetical protein [Halococcus salsus]
MVFVDAPRTILEITLAVVAVCCLAFELVRAAHDRWHDRPGLAAVGHGLVSVALVLQSIRLTGLGPAFGYAATVRALADLGILLASLGALSMWYSNRTKPSADRTSEVDSS